VEFFLLILSYLISSVCIGDGDTQPEDTINGFLMNMNKQVEYFNKAVQKNGKLKNGFHAVGLSQGNLLVRGYIEKYNSPRVDSFLSIHGPLAGVGSLPRCNPRGFAGALCKKVTDLVGDVAYSSTIQNMVAQANYLKDPFEISLYKKENIFLPFLNNEVEHADSQKYKDNFKSLNKLILVKALDDTMIFPRESEWFGYYKNGDDKIAMPYNMTDAYINDLFGLRSLDEENKIKFDTSAGDHLQFNLDDLKRYIKILLE